MENPNNNQPVAVKAAPKKLKPVTYADIVPKDWDKRNTGNCHYVFIATGCRDPQQHISDVCFARFRSPTGISKGKFLINQHTKTSTYTNNDEYIKDEKFRAKLVTYINWVVRNSPFRWAFLNGRTNFLKVGLNFNSKVSHKYVFGACNAVREGWEFPWRVNFWHQLVDAGVSPELSYYVVSMIGKSGAVLGGQGHAVIQRSPTGQAFDWFRSLTKKGVEAIGVPMCKAAPDTYGVSQLFCNGKNPAKHKDLFKGRNLASLLKSFAPVKEDDGWGGVVADFTVFPPELITALKEIDRA